MRRRGFATLRIEQISGLRIRPFMSLPSAKRRKRPVAAAQVTRPAQPEEMATLQKTGLSLGGSLFTAGTGVLGCCLFASAQNPFWAVATVAGVAGAVGVGGLCFVVVGYRRSVLGPISSQARSFREAPAQRIGAARRLPRNIPTSLRRWHRKGQQNKVLSFLTHRLPVPSEPIRDRLVRLTAELFRLEESILDTENRYLPENLRSRFQKAASAQAEVIWEHCGRLAVVERQGIHISNLESELSLAVSQLETLGAAIHQARSHIAQITLGAPRGDLEIALEESARMNWEAAELIRLEREGREEGEDPKSPQGR